MADQIKQQFVGDSTDAQKAVKDLQAQILKLENDNAKMSAKSIKDLEKLREEFKAAARDVGGIGENAKASTGFLEELTGQSKSLQSQLAGLVTPMLSFTAGIAMARSAFSSFVDFVEERNRIADKASQAQMSAGNLMMRLKTSAVGSSPSEQNQFVEDVRQIQRDTGHPSLQQIVFAAEGASSSSMGNINNALGATRTAAEATKHQPDATPAFATGIADVMGGAGIDDPNKVSGFLFQAAETARIANMSDWARTVPQAVKVGIPTVPETANKEQAAIDVGALFAAMTQGMNDPTGDKSATAVNMGLLQMRDYFTKPREVTGRGGKKTTLAPPEDPGTVHGRLEYFMNAPEEERKRFLEDANLGREGARIPYEDLFNRKGVSYEAYSTFRDRATFDESVHHRQVQTMPTGNPIVALADVQNKMESDRQQAELNLSSGGALAAARNLNDNIYSNSKHPSMLHGMSRWWATTAGGDESAIFRLNQQEIAQEMQAIKGNGAFSFFGADPNRKLTADESREMERLQKDWQRNEELRNLYDQARPEDRAMRASRRILDERDSSEDQKIQSLLDVSDKYVETLRNNMGNDFSYESSRDPARQVMRDRFDLSDDQIGMLEMRREFEQFQQLNRRPELAPAVRAEARGGGER